MERLVELIRPHQEEGVSVPWPREGEGPLGPLARRVAGRRQTVSGRAAGVPGAALREPPPVGLLPPTLAPRAPSREGLLQGGESCSTEPLSCLEACPLFPHPQGLKRERRPPGFAPTVSSMGKPFSAVGAGFLYSIKAFLALQRFAEQAHLGLIHATKEGCVG